MAITSTLLAHLLILSLAMFCLNAKIIKECDDIEKNYIENPSNCSEFIYCDGASSIYCSGDCSVEIDCDAQVATPPTTNATTGAITNNTTTTTTTTTTATSLTTKALNQTVVTTTRPSITATSQVSPLPTTISVETTTMTPSVSTPTATSPTTTSVRQLCRKGSFEKYPFPANCNYYYDCLDGFLMLQQCPFGMGWNVKTKKCNLSKKALCPNEENE